MRFRLDWNPTLTWGIPLACEWWPGGFDLFILCLCIEVRR